MHWLYELCCCLWSLPAPATPRPGHSYRPRFDILEGREPPASVTPSPLPAEAEVGQSISLTVTLTNDTGNGVSQATFTVDWGDGTRDGTKMNIVGGAAAFSDSHSYGPASQGLASNVVIDVHDNVPGHFDSGSILAGTIIIPATGNTTIDFRLLPLKGSFSPSSGNTKLPMLLVNDSTQPVDGPFFVVLNGLSHSVKLKNETGLSKLYAPGKPYLFVGVGQLNPGQALPFTLILHSSTGHRVSPTSFQAVVVAGVGLV
jgi:hypothetical protein